MAAPADPSVFRRHGGRAAAAARAYGFERADILDLSTGINPRPYPVWRGSQEAAARLPDPEDLRALEAAAAQAFGASSSQVAAVPGAEAAIRLIPRLTGARSVALDPVTYGGHAEAWRAAGAAIVAPGERAQARVLVNPNNPDGRRVPAAAILAEAASRWTIVDEAFADPDPRESVADRAGGRLIVLRSFGKFYGLAGLRLGFVVAGEPVIAAVRAAFGDWPVSGAAIAAGRAAYADAGWRLRTRARLARDAARLDGLLAEAGLEVLGGAHLFRLASTPDAQSLFDRLARAGILCRPFDQHPTWLRFGLPGPPAAWARLKATLAGAGS